MKMPPSAGFASPGGPYGPSLFSRITVPLRQLYLAYVRLVAYSHPYPLPRYLVTALLLLLFLLRVISLQGWYVVTYALGIYLLNAFLAFLTPKFSPEEDSLSNDADLSDPASESIPTSLPTTTSSSSFSSSSGAGKDEEFRPFIRRLPEFVFWETCTKAILISFFCTFFDFLDIPVFWPVLLIYFIILFLVTMKRQIRHMIKHKYIPFDFGKERYGASRK